MNKFKAFMQPWNFLFTGTPHDKKHGYIDIQNTWKHIDAYCECYKLSDDVAVILSLLALNLIAVTPKEVRDVCQQLNLSEHHTLKFISILSGTKTRKAASIKRSTIRFPCLLIIDQVSCMNLYCISSLSNYYNYGFIAEP